MKALILAAGYGTRLAAIAKDTPKPLLDVAGKPLIDYTVNKLKALKGLDEIVVVTNNKFYDVFCRWADEHNKFGDTQHNPNYPKTIRTNNSGYVGCPQIRIVNDGTNVPEERLGSVGDINFVWEHEKTQDDWLIIGGDNIFIEDLNRFMAMGRAKEPAVTIGLYDINDIAGASKFGVAAIDASDKVISFEEKPAKPRSSLIVMCLYYFPKATLGYIGEYKAVSKALDAAGSYIQWLSQKKHVYGFQFSGKWYDIGSIESLHEAQEFFLRHPS